MSSNVSDSGIEALIDELAQRRHAEDELRAELENLRQAKDRSQRLARRATELQQATSALAGALTAHEASEIFLAVSERVFGAVGGAVYLLDARGRLQLHGALGELRRERTLAPGAAAPAAEAVRSNHSIWLEGRGVLVERYPALVEASASVQALVAWPIMHGARTLGAVALDFAEPRRFDDDELEWLGRFAAQCALAVERARLYAAEREARREAEALFRIAEQLSGAQLDPEAIVQKLTDEGTDLVGASLGAFVQSVAAPDGGTQRLYTVAGARRADVQKLVRASDRLFAVQEPVIRLDDVTSDPQLAQAGAALSVASYLAVPVVSASKSVLGALCFAHPEPGRFTEQHERVVKALAAHAAVAIENARLYRRTREGELKHRQLVEEMAETVRLNDLFTGVLAHDLRNPLTGIITSVRLAQMRSKDEQLAKPLARIVTSAERMMRMVEQLLDFARVRLGETMPLSPRPADLAPIVRHAIDELQDAHATRVVLEQSGDTTGVWDPDRLGQVFSNLIGNALQHGAGQEVRVEVDGRAPGAIGFRIHNQGAIPPALLPRLFEPLASGQQPHGKSRGLGLGLYIAQQIASAHGARVEVQSNEADGTTFAFTLPRRVQAPTSVTPTGPKTIAEARERAWQTEQRMRLLVDSIRDYAIFMLDAGGHVVSWNIGAQRLKGYTAAEIVGKHISTFYTPNERAEGRPQMLLAEAVSQGRVEDLGWRVRKDGTVFWADVVITALKDSKGDLSGFAKVTRDLTERRVDEERLRRSEEQFRLMVESVRDYAIFKLDPQGIVTTWNLGAQRIKGYRADEIIGQHFSKFYEPEEIASGKCEMELEVAARDGQFIDEGWRLRKDGTRFWANVVITALRASSGTLVGFTKVTRDLTERMKLEDERVRSARAEEALRLRDEFLSMASHELKTPLTGLQLQLQALERRLDNRDEKVSLNLHRASESGERLAALVESLLDVSRITAGRFELETETLDLSALVRACADGFQPRAAKAHCPLHVEAARPVVGRWDRPRLENLITALVMNAIKYGAGAPIDISVTGDEEAAVLEVRDHGPGLAAHSIDDVFTRFNRQASPRHYGGLGLGLYLVREIARAHGGDVSANNAGDGGARFVVRLPRVPPLTVAADHSPQELQ